MQTIRTKVIPATNTKPTRIKAITSSGKSYTCSSDKFDSIQDAHRGTAYALMLEMKWTGVMVGGDTAEGTVWVFLDVDSPIIENDAQQTIVNIHTGNAAFQGTYEMERILGMLKDSASLNDLHTNKIYDINGNSVGYIKRFTTPYQPKTGKPCSCKKGQQRDNCPNCEGTGMAIDFASIRARCNK